MADIRTDSRYAQARILRDENNIEYIDWFEDIKFDLADFEDNFEYRVKAGDTVFSIADQFYDEQKYYWVVCRANVIFNPFLQLVPGTKFVLPSERTFLTTIIGEI